MVFRVLFLCTYGDLSVLFQDYKGDLLKTFWIGFRCDTVVLCFALTPPLLLNLLGFLFGFNQKLISGFNRFVQLFDKIYFIILFVVVFWISVMDYFYYRNFQTHFDPRFFGFVEDGTKEVMASVWSDYPIIIIILIFTVALFGYLKIVNFIQNRGKIWIRFNKWYAHITVVIFSSALWFLGARSSFSVFPFQKNDLVFSVHLRLNDAAANGVFSMKEAIYDKVKHNLRLDGNNLLDAHQFRTVEEAKRDWSSGEITDSCTFFERHTTPYNAFLESAPPNVVLVIMEGWSSDFFNYHNAQFNLLGALEEELSHLVFYPFCFPVNYGTIAALETFFTNNVGSSLSLSEYSNIPLTSSTALIFKQEGYETSYFTAGYNGWRNIGNYCRTQGFDNVYGAEYLKTLFPKADETDWGVFDQYMFDAVFEKLQEEKAPPQFMICMTITNHSPHKIPKNYKLFSLDFPDSLLSRTNKDKQQTISSLQTFQYANDCLGKFINSLRNSPKGENSIVVVTGDHAMTNGFIYPYSELLYGWAVPLAFYIPEPYAQRLEIDTKRLVSHKDILPTIYNLAFSNYNYSATGDNIFDATTADSAFVVTQSSWVIGKAGCINLNSRQSYTWHENSFYLQPAEQVPELEAMRKRANAWLFGMKWQIYNDLEMR
jgi:phosphoglycerol transferase MdoB-like AlkP superfamily enzyme